MAALLWSEPAERMLEIITTIRMMGVRIEVMITPIALHVRLSVARATAALTASVIVAGSAIAHHHHFRSNSVP